MEAFTNTTKITPYFSPAEGGDPAGSTPLVGRDTPGLPVEERKRTDCHSELEYSLEYDTQRSKYLWQIILSMLTADPTPFIRYQEPTEPSIHQSELVI